MSDENAMSTADSNSANQAPELDDYQAERELLREQLARVEQLTEMNLAPDEDDRLHTHQEAAQHLARLQSARAALKLAATLLEMNSNPTARELKNKIKELEGQATEWKQTTGWFEDRWVRRPKGTFGPYRYFRWRDAEGKLQTKYLGKVSEQQVAYSSYQELTPQVEKAKKAKEAGGMYWLATNSFRNHDLLPFARLDHAEFAAANFKYETKLFRAETHADAQRQYYKFLTDYSKGLAKWD
jgi:hypothetical protein